MLCHGVKAVPAVLLAGSKTALIAKPDYPANAPNRPAPDLFQMAQLATGLAHVRHQGCHVHQAGDFWIITSLVITTPPQEWLTNTTLRGAVLRARWVALMSSSGDVSGCYSAIA